MLAGIPFGRFGLLVSVLILSLCQQAFAQLTAEMLVGPIVEDFKKNKAKYADVDKAIEVIQTGDIDAARTLLTKAKEKNPALPPARVLMGQLLLIAGQGPAARLEFERAVIDTPADPEAYLIFGEAAVRELRVTDAELLFKEARKAGQCLQGQRQTAEWFSDTGQCRAGVCGREPRAVAKGV